MLQGLETLIGLLLPSIAIILSQITKPFPNVRRHPSDVFLSTLRFARFRNGFFYRASLRPCCCLLAHIGRRTRRRLRIRNLRLAGHIQWRRQLQSNCQSQTINYASQLEQQVSRTIPSYNPKQTELTDLRFPVRQSTTKSIRETNMAQSDLDSWLPRLAESKIGKKSVRLYIDIFFLLF